MELNIDSSNHVSPHPRFISNTKKHWLFALLKEGKKKTKSQTEQNLLHSKKPITKILVIETAVGENYEADFLIFSEKWNWVTQGQGISIFLSVYLVFSATPAESNLSEKEPERYGERASDEETGRKKRRKRVNKLLLVTKIWY